MREAGGLEVLVACSRVDGNNPWIRDHALMCLRFSCEGCEANLRVLGGMDVGRGPLVGEMDDGLPEEGRGLSGLVAVGGGVPREVLDANGYETFVDGKGQIGLRRKAAHATSNSTSTATTAAAPPQSKPPRLGGGGSGGMAGFSGALAGSAGSGGLSAPGGLTGSAGLAREGGSGLTKMTAEKAAELMQSALRDLPLGNELVSDRQKSEALARLDRAFESTEVALGGGGLGGGGTGGGGGAGGGGKGKR